MKTVHFLALIQMAFINPASAHAGLIHDAIREEDLPGLKFLIEQSADPLREVNTRDELTGETPLRIAAAGRHIKALELLLLNGASIEAEYPTLSVYRPFLLHEQRGVSFPFDVEERIKNQFGFSLTTKELQHTYSKVFADGTIQIEFLGNAHCGSLNGDQIDSSDLYSWKVGAFANYLAFKINFLDSLGKSKGFARVHLRPLQVSRPESVKNERAIDFHIDIVKIDPVYRGRGFSKNFLKATARFLRRLNQSPRTRISLTAYNGESAYCTDLCGAYIWSVFGFEYIPETVDFSWRLRVQESFSAWFFQTYSLKVSQEERRKILSRFESWEFPWQIALYNTVDDLGRPLGQLEGRVGKEFLANPHSVLQVES